MRAVAKSAWSEGYAFRPFSVKTTAIDFAYSRRNAASACKGCNIAAVWTPYVQETLVNGVLQGRKQTDPRGASLLSKARFWDAFLQLRSVLGKGGQEIVTPVNDYEDFKRSNALKTRREVKNKATEVALKGWNQRSNDA